MAKMAFSVVPVKTQRKVGASVAKERRAAVEGRSVPKKVEEQRHARAAGGVAKGDNALQKVSGEPEGGWLRRDRKGRAKPVEEPAGMEVDVVMTRAEYEKLRAMSVGPSEVFGRLGR